MEEAKVKIKSFIGRYIRIPDLSDDVDIFASGLVNSLFAMQLVMFLEKEFKISISNEDIDLNNFRTINAISKLIENKSTIL